MNSIDALVSYANKYKDFYTLNISSAGVFHVACGCVVGQQVSFSVGRNIRKQLYEKYGNPLKREIILGADLTSIVKLTDKRSKLLLEMAKIDDERDVNLVIQDYAKLNGFGIWTKNAVSILMNVNRDINLSHDYYIRKNLSIYLNKTITQKQCHDYILLAKNNQTAVSYFLWRIKKESVEKVKSERELVREDFI